jgi:uncharacterized protein YdiU (UPF0061 family)
MTEYAQEQRNLYPVLHCVPRPSASISAMPELSRVLPIFTFDNTYARELDGFYVRLQPDTASTPELLYINHALAESLQLTLQNSNTDTLAHLFAGQSLPLGAEPIAQMYAGHQFGHFNPQLGDGRALIMGEVLDERKQRYDICLKGSGRTPFSRGGDGKATIGPMLREALISEALHALGVPSTRATGDSVYRDTVLPGAILTRVASSHIRVGTFEYFACRGEHQRLKQLADYTINRHDPELAGADNPYLAFFRAVTQRQATLVAQWMSVGFIHGVMNTDNMSIAGETIDYGPCAFMDAYDPMTVFSSVDHYHRYAYHNQPRIAQWNLSRLGQSLMPLINNKEERMVTQVSDVLDEFTGYYQQAWLERMLGKMGLSMGDDPLSDKPLVESWLELLYIQQVDFTQAWRRLADAAEGNIGPLSALFRDQTSLDNWLREWQERCHQEQGDELTRATSMRKTNPWIIPRNHQVEAALEAASSHHDLQPFEDLMNALQQPFNEKPNYAHLADPAPMEFTEQYQTFCGT